MIRQKRTKLFSAVIAAFMTLSLFVGFLPAPAYAVTQAEIDELERQKKKLEEQIEEKQADIEELEKQHADATEMKKALDERNVFLVRQIRLNDEQIAIYDALIAQKAEEVKEAKRLEDEQLQRWRARVRAMEENGNGSYLAMLFNSRSIGEFLTAIDDIGEIMQSDKMLEDQYIAARKNTERVKAEYEKFKAGLEAKKEQLKQEQAKLEEEIIEATAQLEKIKLEIDQSNSELEKLNQKEEDAQALIEKKKAELEEQKRREEEARQAAAAAAAAAAGGGNYGTVTGSGNFAWPCACTYITSMVGNRLHPISGVWRYHSGMDIGCQFGDSVWASDGGTVILAGWNGGYGNCVIIDHGYVNGDNYSTLYGHLSSINVSVGQTVSQGQVIGLVGSTGNSTGPHLHFEIRNSSGPTDFSWRFSGLTYAPDSGG